MMAWVANGGLRYGALVAQEAKESLHHAEPGCDGTWGELVVQRGLDPGINIGGCGLCEVLIEDGLPRRWGDPFKAFVGDVQGQEPDFSGYGVYYPPIATAAARLGAHAEGRTGWTVAEIEDQIRAGNPVVVWLDSSFRVLQPGHWTAWDGVDVPYIVGEHAVTVMGFDDSAGTITVVDVLRGELHSFSTSTFAAILTTFGGMGVAVSG